MPLFGLVKIRDLDPLCLTNVQKYNLKKYLFSFLFNLHCNNCNIYIENGGENTCVRSFKTIMCLHDKSDNKNI